MEASEKKRILIVDDEQSFTRLIKLNLEKTGRYEVLEENRSWNLAAVRGFKPDLILLDVIMPGLDGGQVAARLQADPNTRHIPVIFLTATVRKQEIDSHRGIIGGFPFVAKPVDLEVLMERIEEHLKKAAPADPAPPPA